MKKSKNDIGTRRAAEREARLAAALRTNLRRRKSTAEHADEAARSLSPGARKPKPNSPTR